MNYSVIVINPACGPLRMEIGSDYKNLQALVGGLLSASELAENLAVMYHDEGLLIGAPPNMRTPGGALLCGTLVVTRCDNEGEQCDVTEADMRLAQELVETSRRYVSSYNIPPARIISGNNWDEMQRAAREPMPSVEYQGTGWEAPKGA